MHVGFPIVHFTRVLLFHTRTCLVAGGTSLTATSLGHVHGHTGITLLANATAVTSLCRRHHYRLTFRFASRLCSLGH